VQGKPKHWERCIRRWELEAGSTAREMSAGQRASLKGAKMRKWCYWQQMGCKEFENGCGAHLAEGRFMRCPFRESDIDPKLGKPAKDAAHYRGVCEDYKPVPPNKAALRDEEGK